MPHRKSKQANNSGFRWMGCSAKYHWDVPNHQG